MKTILVISAIIFSLSAFAVELPEEVLIEHTTMVGFAPASHRGTYRWQILSSGAIQKINNKNKKTSFGKLSANAIASLKEGIDRIKDAELKRPDSPPCMDAPTSEISVRQSNGTSMEIWRRAGCRDAVTNDSIAMKIKEIIDGLYGAFSTIENLPKYE